MTSPLLSWDEAKKAVNDRQEAGQTVVFTNGCFDILHAGHVQYLEEARALGDCLVLGLNTDASVQRNKGPLRPIVSTDHRAKVLAGLAAVDMIVAFDEDTPIDLLAHLKPDIHVKGGDYVAEDLPEYPTVSGYGGEVHILSFLPDCSTSAIIDRILKAYS